MSKTQRAYQDIIGYYLQIEKDSEPVGFPRFPRLRLLLLPARWGGNHLYKGKHNNNKKISNSFKELIHHIAVIDPKYLEALKDKVINDTSFITIFEEIQKNAIDKLRMQDEQYLKKLFEDLFCEEDEENVSIYSKKSFYLNTKNHSQTIALTLSQACNLYIYGNDYDKKLALLIFDEFNSSFSEDIKLVKLIHDLEWIRNKRQTELDFISHQLKLLKKKINAFQEEKFFNVRLKNTVVTKFNHAHPIANIYEKEVFEKISDEKIKNRALKKGGKIGGSVTGFFAALGEGAVAAFALFLLLPFAPLWVFLLVVGIPGFLCNFFLLRGGFYQTFKANFTKRKITHDQNEHPYDQKCEYTLGFFAIPVKDHRGTIIGYKKMSTGLKTFMFGVSALSLSSSFVFGALSTVSIYQTILGIVGTKTIISLALVAAVIPGICTAVGIAAILINVVKDFIVNERWIGIKHYFVSKYGHIGWKALTPKQKVGHVCHCIFFEAPKLLFGLLIFGVVTVATFGFLQSHAVNLLNIITSAKIGAKVAKTIATAASVINGLSWGPLNMQTIVGTISSALSLRSVIKTTLKVLAVISVVGLIGFAIKSFFVNKEPNFLKTMNKDINELVDDNITVGRPFTKLDVEEEIKEDVPENKVHEIQGNVVTTKKILVGITPFINGPGQGALASSVWGGLCSGAESTILNFNAIDDDFNKNTFSNSNGIFTRKSVQKEKAIEVKVEKNKTKTMRECINYLKEINKELEEKKPIENEERQSDNRLFFVNKK